VVEQGLKIQTFHMLAEMVVQVEEEQVMVGLVVNQEEQVTHLQLLLPKVKMVELMVMVDQEQQET
jgi:pentose-5-phosphate-3-epimerase